MKTGQLINFKTGQVVLLLTPCRRLFPCPGLSHQLFLTIYVNAPAATLEASSRFSLQVIVGIVLSAFNSAPLTAACRGRRERGKFFVVQGQAFDSADAERLIGFRRIFNLIRGAPPPPGFRNRPRASTVSEKATAAETVQKQFPRRMPSLRSRRRKNYPPPALSDVVTRLSPSFPVRRQTIPRQAAEQAHPDRLRFPPKPGRILRPCFQH